MDFDIKRYIINSDLLVTFVVIKGEIEKKMKAHKQYTTKTDT